MSGAVKQHYAEALGLEPIEIIHNGVDADEMSVARGADGEAIRRRLGIPSGRSLLLCAGRFRHEKGHRYLIAALSELKERGVQPALVLAGTGPLADAVATDVGHRGLRDQVQFVGHLDHAELMELMAAVDIVVVPSVHEGLSVTAAEALMLGKPVIASNVGGLAEVVEAGISGVLVPPADPAALAGSIARLILDEALRKCLGKEGERRAMRRFRVADVAAAHERLFERLRDHDAGRLRPAAERARRLDFEA